METLIIIVAFWLILLGLYGGWLLLRDMNARQSVGNGLVSGLPERHRDASDAFQRQIADAAAAMAHSGARRAQTEPRSSSNGLSSEVTILRSQVEQLRTELVALSRTPRQRVDRPRLRRYRTGAYTYLPRVLRSKVHRVRHARRVAGN